MSRCFPYPPPGYCRNGATYEALIESIKLQKETNKIKAERKQEKKAKKEKEKKHKERKYNDAGVKLQNNRNDDYHKVSQKSADCTKAQIKATNTTNEPFEKSDLTEEHGPSISSHQPSYSSDSTQNSNKRKRDDASLLPDDSSGHGKPIKIRLLKKHKGSDFNNFVADERSNTHLSVPSSSYSEKSLVSGVKKNVLPATSEGTKIRDPNRLYFARIQSAQSSAKPIFQSCKPQEQPTSSFGRQVLPRIHLKHEIPSTSVSRTIDEHELCSSSRPQQLAPSRHGMPNSVSNTTSTSAAGKRSHNEVALSQDDGLASLKKPKEDQQKAGPTRFEKKMMKKHSKYEKLIGSWLPPVFQAHLPDVPDDDDWLSKSKTSNSSISKGEAKTCCQLVSSWQPCARFLADVDMHALPYTVPF